MKSTDSVGVTFVNTVLGQGVLNGNVNLSFGQLLFTPDADTGRIDPDLVVALRLRMDIVCAKQLRDNLTNLLEKVEQAEIPGAVPLVAAEEVAN